MTMLTIHNVSRLCPCYPIGLSKFSIANKAPILRCLNHGFHRRFNTQPTTMPTTFFNN